MRPSGLVAGGSGWPWHCRFRANTDPSVPVENGPGSGSGGCVWGGSEESWCSSGGRAPGGRVWLRWSSGQSCAGCTSSRASRSGSLSARSPFARSTRAPATPKPGHKCRLRAGQRDQQLARERVARQTVARAHPHPAPPPLRRQQLPRRLIHATAVLGATPLALGIVEALAIGHLGAPLSSRPAGRGPTTPDPHAEGVPPSEGAARPGSVRLTAQAHRTRRPLVALVPRCDSDGARAPTHREVTPADVVPMAVRTSASGSHRRCTSRWLSAPGCRAGHGERVADPIDGAG
jgi:hypothetical protein